MTKEQLVAAAEALESKVNETSLALRRIGQLRVENDPAFAGIVMLTRALAAACRAAAQGKDQP
jgi:hypothetical protein